MPSDIANDSCQPNHVVGSSTSLCTTLDRPHHDHCTRCTFREPLSGIGPISIVVIRFAIVALLVRRRITESRFSTRVTEPRSRAQRSTGRACDGKFRARAYCVTMTSTPTSEGFEQPVRCLTLVAMTFCNHTIAGPHIRAHSSLQNPPTPREQRRLFAQTLPVLNAVSEPTSPSVRSTLMHDTNIV